MYKRTTQLVRSDTMSIEHDACLDLVELNKGYTFRKTYHIKNEAQFERVNGKCVEKSLGVCRLHEIKGMTTVVRQKDRPPLSDFATLFFGDDFRGGQHECAPVSISELLESATFIQKIAGLLSGDFAGKKMAVYDTIMRQVYNAVTPLLNNRHRLLASLRSTTKRSKLKSAAAFRSALRDEDVENFEELLPAPDHMKDGLLYSSANLRLLCQIFLDLPTLDYSAYCDISKGCLELTVYIAMKGRKVFVVGSETTYSRLRWPQILFAQRKILKLWKDAIQTFKDPWREPDDIFAQNSSPDALYPGHLMLGDQWDPANLL